MIDPLEHDRSAFWEAVASIALSILIGVQVAGFLVCIAWFVYLIGAE